MGAGNTNTSGQKKNNHSFQHRNLILLGQVKTAVEELDGETVQAATPGVLDITGIASTTLNTWKSFTFVCVAGTIDIIGQTFPAGTYSFSNGKGTLTSIAYDASAATDCKIIYVI
tara:strand:- start:540 stop:884 length:345 start_codon:yes stop_codon:yes gene_type:complete